MLSGQTAAATLAATLATDELSAEALSQYELGWRKRLGSELRWQMILRRIAQRLSDTDIDRLFELARTGGIMPLVRRTATFNRRRPGLLRVSVTEKSATTLEGCSARADAC